MSKPWRPQHARPSGKPSKHYDIPEETTVQPKPIMYESADFEGSNNYVREMIKKINKMNVGPDVVQNNTCAPKKGRYRHENMKLKTGNRILNQSCLEARSLWPVEAPSYPQPDTKLRILQHPAEYKSTTMKSQTSSTTSQKTLNPSVINLPEEDDDSFHNFHETVGRTNKQHLLPKSTLPTQVSKCKIWNCPPTSSELTMYEEVVSSAKTNFRSDETVGRTNDQYLHPKPTQPSQVSKFKEPPSLYKDASSAKLSGRDSFADILSQLKMQHCRKSKLSIKDVLSIGEESVKNIELRAMEDIHQYFLQKVMALDDGARNTTLNKSSGKGDEWDLNFHNSENIDYNLENSIHPLDVLCAVFHCSDNFLQQELISKMSLCQFAVPLILPPGDGTKYIFLLWAMRGVVKRWRPHSLAETRGFIEDNLVNVCMPTFSFVRLGECSLSKSKIINQLLCQSQTYYDIFVNHDMDCGNGEKRIANGLVEISWFFPGSANKSEIFQEPMAVTNLRGDLNNNWRQFAFLTNISAAVFIFTENVSEKEYELLLSYRDAKTHYYFIIDTSNDKQTNKKTIEIVKKMSKEPKVHFLKTNIRNAKELVRQIRQITIQPFDTQVCLQDLAAIASKYDIHVDENAPECQKARRQAISITSEIKNVSEFKKTTMPLQGDLWKELSKTEKELCRMKYQGNTNISTYKRTLSKKYFDLHRTQYQSGLPGSIRNYLTSLMTLSTVERGYFIGWMKFYLEEITRKSLLCLQAEYKEKYNELSKNPHELNQLYYTMSNSSLGVDHFLRELGQFYEAECCMVDKNEIQSNQKQFSKLPAVAADLLLDGFPLELIDGEVSNIPLKWITAVLKELNKKIEGRCRMRVITVLGVQSTGKSTLLNTMFGLQFPVASGRCTRGAFMTLIKVKENFKKELGYDFILVIDTEGLKAPELASLEGSYDHDNELATLVVGLSDITIVNMAMENTTEMKDILQIVVHAFLRMKEVGRKRNCFLVHQNVNDVSAYLNNRINRNKLLNELNDMTCIAAKMEKIQVPVDFSDIMNYHPDKHSWYIPSLWHGVPPMAPINSGYSENISKLKRHLFEFMKTNQNSGPQNTDSFIEWMNSLWKAVKYETFIFSFRNTLVADAYDQLSTKYSELEWNFRSQVYTWLTKQENIIKNQPQNKLKSVTMELLQNETTKLLDREEAYMKEQLKLFFDQSISKMYVAERYRADFMSYVKCLRHNMEVIISTKCWEAVKIQSGKQEIQNMQESCLKAIEEKVNIHLTNHRVKSREMTNIELKKEFDSMWDKVVQELQVGRLKKHRIDYEMLEQFKKEMKNKGCLVIEILHTVTSLKYYGQDEFKMKKSYINIPFWSSKKVKEFFTNGCYKKLTNVAKTLQYTCQNYVADRIKTGEDYNELYCQELLNIINEKLDQEEVRKLNPTAEFDVDLKLHILGAAAPQFQKMHDDFGLKNDPRLLTNRLKPHYFDIFKNKLHEKDESTARAKDFCDRCLKPAITDHIYRNLGKEIISDILKDSLDIKFNSQNHFHFKILKELLEMNKFEHYAEYITNYGIYVKRWISKYIVMKYKNSSCLDMLVTKIISSVTKKIQSALRDTNVQKSQNVTEFFELFRKMLFKNLVISENSMKVIIFQNTANIHQFANDIIFYIGDCQEQIRSEMKHLGIESLLHLMLIKPQDELLKKVLGCGKKCPFCNAPCEARGDHHEKHFVSAHRPKGLTNYRYSEDNTLCTTTCSIAIISNDTFRNPDTEGRWHPYRDYRSVYPQWIIQPEINSKSSLHWKFVFARFNNDFAKLFQTVPAEIPEKWLQITQRQALSSLESIYNIK